MDHLGLRKRGTVPTVLPQQREEHGEPIKGKLKSRLDLLGYPNIYRILLMVLLGPGVRLPNC